MKAQPLCFVSIKRPKMCLICFFGALVITSGVFSQDTTTVLPEVRGKIYLFRKHTLLIQRVGSVQACLFSSSPPLTEVFAAVSSSVKILCTDGGEKGVEWRFNSSVLVSSPVLFIQNTSLKNQGIYTCHQPNGNLILTVSLHLGCRFMHIVLYLKLCSLVKKKISHYPRELKLRIKLKLCSVWAI